MVLANENASAPKPKLLAASTGLPTPCTPASIADCRVEGPLPGGLKIKRRAKGLLHERLAEPRAAASGRGRLDAMNYVSAFAIAVNEENACGGRVVTAPTNGAAGVVPAVLRYYRDFCTPSDRKGCANYFSAATAIGGIIKRNASISGAEMGCQGEVGSARPWRRQALPRPSAAATSRSRMPPRSRWSITWG